MIVHYVDAGLVAAFVVIFCALCAADARRKARRTHAARQLRSEVARLARGPVIDPTDARPGQWDHLGPGPHRPRLHDPDGGRRGD